MQEAADRHDISDIFAGGDRLTYARGDNIIRPNQPTSKVFYIESGFVEVYTINGNGDRTVHVIYGPGDMFPIAWTLDGKRRDPYCKALTETVLKSLDRNDFSETVTSQLTASRQYNFQVLKQFGVYVNHVTNLQLSRNRERLLCSLLYFGDRFGRRVDDTLVVEAPLTQEVIARSINMSRESVSRQLTGLRDEGIVGVQQNGFFVICALTTAVAAVSEFIDISVFRFL